MTSAKYYHTAKLCPMTPLALTLVLLASVAHSSWNFLLKRSEDNEVFIWGLLVAASVLLAPLGVMLAWQNPIEPVGWWFVTATIVLHILYFGLLGRSYTEGDLSLVYPIARGMGPMLVPILAVVFLGETIATSAIAGIVVIVAGIYTVSWWGNFRRLARHPLDLFRNPSTRFAILTGFTIAAYTIIDKGGVGHVQPFLYMYLMTLGSAIGLFPYVLAKRKLNGIRHELRHNSVAILVAGGLTFLAYGLVLTAFSLSRVSYVAPAREIGIVVTVLIGTLVLKEPFGAGRLLGSLMIVAGLLLIALSP